jgi:acetyl-CoA synthetase
MPARSPYARTLLGRLNLSDSLDTGRLQIAIPQQANIAADTVARHAKGARADRLALVFEAQDGSRTQLTYRELDDAATRVAAALTELGIGRGARVAVHTGQRPETAITHLAVYKLGGIVVTVSQLHGPDTVRHILKDSGSQLLVTEESAWSPLRHLRARLPALKDIVIADGAPAAVEKPFARLLDAQVRDFLPVDTGSDKAALLIYTSGSTGLPKGILHAHRILWAYNISTSLFYNLEMEENDLVFWTPADWAWVGGLNDTVFPAWFHGHTIVATQHRFNAEWAYEFMARHGVTHSFMTPTALKRLAQVEAPRQRYPKLVLRTVWTGGESLPGETLQWLESVLGVTCNEGYGLTEVNHMIGNCARLSPAKPGSMGFELPGHRVLLVDEDGNEVPDGEPGEVVTTEDNATLFLGYWNRSDLTREMRLGRWVRTRDLAVKDADGYFFYRGRSDDLIKSAGFRIGPAEIEGCLATHPLVADCGVIGIPDEERGQVIKAFILLKEGAAHGDALAEELRAHVRARLGGYKTPRSLEFVAALPITTSGKVSRKDLRRLEAEKGGPT